MYLNNIAKKCQKLYNYISLKGAHGSNQSNAPNYGQEIDTLQKQKERIKKWRSRNGRFFRRLQNY